MLDWLKETEMATRLETAIARVIAEGKVRTYDMSGRRGDTDSPWRGRQRFHARRSQSHRGLRWVAHASRVLVSVSRRNRLSFHRMDLIDG